MKKLPIFILIMFILLLFSVSASTYWYRWGNQDFFNYGVLFGSNYPQGTSNMTQYLEALDPTYQPIVGRFSSQIYNEIIWISDDTIYAYDPYLGFIDSYTSTFDLSNIQAVDYDGDVYQDIVFCEDDDMIFFELQDNSFTAIASHDDVCKGFNNYLYDYIYVDEFESRGWVYLLTTQGGGNRNVQFQRVNVTTGTVDTIHSTIKGLSCSGLHGSPATVSDIDKDDEVEIIAIMYDGADGRIELDIWDEDGNLEREKGLKLGVPDYDSCNIAVAQVGTEQGFKEIIANYYAQTHNQSISQYYDYTTNTIHGWTTDYVNKSFYAVADIDGDGQNEICNTNQTVIRCKNSLGIDELRLNISDTYAERYGYISIGEYNQDTSYMEIITSDGIYEIRNKVGVDAELHKITELEGLDSYNAQALPVSLVNPVAYIKDLLLWEDDRLIAYISELDTTTCGNDICETGETVYTCCSDCCGLTQDVEITYYKICPSPNYVIQNGTTLEVTLTVESNTDSDIQSRVIFDQGTSNQYDTDWSSNKDSGYTAIHTRLINRTGLNVLSLQGRNYGDVSIFTEEEFELSILADEGITFEDGICLVGGTELEVPAQNETIGYYTEGSPCDENSDCASGFCSLGVCHLKYGGNSCTTSSECLTGNCLNGRCTKQSLLERLTTLKEDYFGKDQGSSDIISIIIILILTVGVGVFFAIIVKDAKPVAAICLAVFIILLILFTSIKWLSPFFLIGLIILALILFIFVFMAKGDSS